MRMFLSVSGHSSELSIANHSPWSTASQLKCVSDTISSWFENHQPQKTKISSVIYAPFIQNSWNENLQQKQNWTAKSTNLEGNAWKVFRVALWAENPGRCHDYFGSSKLCKENLQLQSTLEAIRFLNRNTEYMFAISFRKHRDEKRKTTCYLWLSKCKISSVIYAPFIQNSNKMAFRFDRNHKFTEGIFSTPVILKATSKLFGSRGCFDDKNWLDFSSIFFKICRCRSSILLSL